MALPFIPGPADLGVNGFGSAVMPFLESRRNGKEPWHQTLNNKRWVSWEAYHLAKGAKIALDYFNIPGPAGAAAAKVQKKIARGLAPHARKWAEQCMFQGPFLYLSRQPVS